MDLSVYMTSTDLSLDLDNTRFITQGNENPMYLPNHVTKDIQYNLCMTHIELGQILNMHSGFTIANHKYTISMQRERDYYSKNLSILI